MANTATPTLCLPSFMAKMATPKPGAIALVYGFPPGALAGFESASKVSILSGSKDEAVAMLNTLEAMSEIGTIPKGLSFRVSALGVDDIHSIRIKQGFDCAVLMGVDPLSVVDAMRVVRPGGRVLASVEVVDDPFGASIESMASLLRDMPGVVVNVWDFSKPQDEADLGQRAVVFDVCKL